MEGSQAAPNCLAPRWITTGGPYPLRVRTANRAARTQSVGAQDLAIAHHIWAFCLPVSFRPFRDFFTIGITPTQVERREMLAFLYRNQGRG